MLGQTLNGRYKLTRILGAGGFGQTYLAIDTRLSNRPLCVVKQLKPASQDANFLTVARRLFETEVKTLERLGSHLQIPRLLDSFEEDSEFYLVQEYIDGKSLDDKIKQAGKFSEAEIIALLEGVLPILKFVHEHHVVHRDLKPDNLICCQSTGKIVLIDFGAVKEIRTRLLTGEQTGLTIGIGTQGYTPSEQLSGKPRYSSDIYALGMTAIHAMTGRSPADLPEDFDSLDPRWQDFAEVSPGLALLLGKMTRHYIYQRYSSVEEVERDLTRLDELPAEAAAADTYVETSIPKGSIAGSTPIVRWKMGKRAKVLTAAIATVLTSAFVLSTRQMGVFVLGELAIYDQLASAQPDLGPDPRLLLVEITESDLQSLKVNIPNDKSVATVIANIQQHKPALIGLDLLRNVPHSPGEDLLKKSLEAENIIAITKIGKEVEGDIIAPPTGMSREQVSFSDIVVDSDRRVRRALIHSSSPDESSKGESKNADSSVNTAEPRMSSLSINLAIGYLEKYQIFPKDNRILQLGDVTFHPISPTFGGYQNEKTAGYEIFMRYRSQKNVAPRISFKDALDDKLDSDLIKDKIVLIGMTTASNRDMFSTIYNTGGNLAEMPRMLVHAQVISQILSAVLDGEKLPWALPDWIETAWIISLTGIGGTLMVLTQRGPILIAFGVSGLTVAYLVGVLCFHAGGWVPIAAPMSAFFLSAAGARISKSYQRRHWEAKQEARQKALSHEP